MRINNSIDVIDCQIGTLVVACLVIMVTGEVNGIMLKVRATQSFGLRTTTLIIMIGMIIGEITIIVA